HGRWAGHRVHRRHEPADGITPVHRWHVGRQHHAVRVVQVREPVSVTGGGESSPVGVSGVDGFFGFGGGVGWGRGLAAEGGGEENGEGVAWAHSASPLGEGEENTGARSEERRVGKGGGGR